MTNSTGHIASDQAEPYYDPFSYEIDEDPYPWFKRLRDETPLYYNDKHDFYALSRYRDVDDASRDWQTFSSARGTVLELLDMPPEQLPRMIIFMDPPQHDRLRKLVNRGFYPRRIAELEPRLREIAGELLAPFERGDTFDLVQDYAGPFSAMVIGALAGVPEEDRHIVRQWNEAGLQLKEGETAAEGIKVLLKHSNSVEERPRVDMQAYFRALADERRKNPREDMISAIIASEIEEEDGDLRPLDNREVLDFIALLSGAGTETVSRMLGWAGVYLPAHPEQMAQLVANPSLIPGAIEELLRIEPPSPVQARVTQQPVTLYGEHLEAGTRVLLLTGSAGRDEREYDEPDRFDIHRNAKHASFGRGVHFCLGAALARLEGRVALEELFRRFPRWEVDQNNAERMHTSTVRGYLRLPVRV